MWLSIVGTIALSILYICFLDKATCCDSIATFNVTETLSTGAYTKTYKKSITDNNQSNFSINVTNLLIKSSRLDSSQEIDSIFLSDVEQSRPFVLRRRSTPPKQWYELTSEELIDRESICNAKLHPERVKISRSCCGPKHDRLSNSGFSCCVFIGLNDPASGIYYVRININDINDHSPQFEHYLLGYTIPGNTDQRYKYEITIDENVEPGNWLPLPRATDLDEGANAELTYDIKSTNNRPVELAHFLRLLVDVSQAGLAGTNKSLPVIINKQSIKASVDASNYHGPGLLVLQKLDREQIGEFIFGLVARDSAASGVRHSAIANIKLILADENDNPPSFERNEYFATVRENQAGINLVKMRVNDPDAGLNARLTYRLTVGQADIQYLDLNNEFLDQHFQLLPVDGGVNLRLNQRIDYETYPSLMLHVISEDHGPKQSLSATTTIKLTILNVNDNAPRIRFFHQGRQLDGRYAKLSIDEHHGNSSGLMEVALAKVHVDDADSQLDQIDCSLDPNQSGLFALRQQPTNRLFQRVKIYQLVALGRLDRELVGQHLIAVRCFDDTPSHNIHQAKHGSDRLVGRGQLQLVLQDVNDNGPVFTQSSYSGEVVENQVNALVELTSLGRRDQLIRATDRDAGVNAQVRYSLTSGDQNETNRSLNESSNSREFDANKTDADFFYIDPNNGQLRTKYALDCELKSLYTFKIVAVDQGVDESLRHTTDVPILIKIRDVNDNRPLLKDRHYAFAIREGLPRLAYVGQVEASDADIDESNRAVVYELKDVVDSNASSYLFIERKTGTIRTRQELDREQVHQLPVIVVARNDQPFRDASQLPSSTSDSTDEASVIVSVIDQNDNAPLMVKKGDRSIANYRYTTVIDLLFNASNDNDENGISNRCIEFPFEFIDLDEGRNAKIKVELKPNDYFELRLDNTLLCQISPVLPRIKQVILYLVVKDDPEESSQIMTRRYTMRVNLIRKRRYLPPTKTDIRDRVKQPMTRGGDKIPPQRTRNINGRFDASRVNNFSTGYQLDQEVSEPKSSRPVLALRSPTLTIIAILVAVSGLLCLLLLIILALLRKYSPSSSEEEPDGPSHKQHPMNHSDPCTSSQFGDKASVCPADLSVSDLASNPECNKVYSQYSNSFNLASSSSLCRPPQYVINTTTHYCPQAFRQLAYAPGGHNQIKSNQYMPVASQAMPVGGGSNCPTAQLHLPTSLIECDESVVATGTLMTSSYRATPLLDHHRHQQLRDSRLSDLIQPPTNQSFSASVYTSQQSMPNHHPIDPSSIDCCARQICSATDDGERVVKFTPTGQNDCKHVLPTDLCDCKDLSPYDLHEKTSSDRDITAADRTTKLCVQSDMSQQLAWACPKRKCPVGVLIPTECNHSSPISDETSKQRSNSIQSNDRVNQIQMNIIPSKQAQANNSIYTTFV